MIPYGRHSIDQSDIDAVVEVLRNGNLTQGPKVREFEQAIERYTGAKYAVAVANGTAGLHLACLAAGLDQTDNVVTTPNSFVASANCARYVGADVYFADIEPATLNMDPKDLEQRCSNLEKVSAIIPVHFAGLPCDMVSIKKIADQYSAIVIEDCAHALGGKYPDGSRVGSCPQSHMSVFSLHPVKNIAAGEGGVITTNDKNLYQRLIELRSHGINKEGSTLVSPEHAHTNGEPNLWYYEMQTLGFNLRITDIQCALANSQLSRIEKFLARRQEIAACYDKAFASISNIQPAQAGLRDGHALHIYVVRIDFDAINIQRNAFMKRLMAEGIGSQVHYIPIHYQPYYRSRRNEVGCYPVAETYYSQALTLPMHYSMSDKDVEHVIDAVRSILEPIE